MWSVCVCLCASTHACGVERVTRVREVTDKALKFSAWWLGTVFTELLRGGQTARGTGAAHMHKRAVQARGMCPCPGDPMSRESCKVKEVPGPKSHSLLP